MSARGLAALACCALLSACGARLSPGGMDAGGSGGSSGVAASAGAGATAGAASVCDSTNPQVSTLTMLDGQRLQESMRRALGDAAPLVEEPLPTAEGVGANPATIGLLHLRIHTLALRLIADSKTLAALTGCPENDESAECRDSFIQSFGVRAYRRPLTDDDTSDLRAEFEMGQKLGENFASGVRAVVEVTLQAPDFLYLAEPGSGCP